MEDSGSRFFHLFEQLVDWALETGLRKAPEYVQQLQEQHPELSADEQARSVVSGCARRNGAVGALTSVGGIATLPLALTADVALSLRIQIWMVVVIAHLYGHPLSREELRIDLLLILAGNSAKDALKEAGIRISEELTRRAIERLLSREAVRHLLEALSRRAALKVGEKALVRTTRAIPLVGAPIGFAADWAMTRSVGWTAIRYYGAAK